MNSATITYLVLAAVLVALEYIALSHLRDTFRHLNKLPLLLRTILRAVIVVAMIATVLYGYMELHDIATKVLLEDQHSASSPVSIASKK